MVEVRNPRILFLDHTGSLGGAQIALSRLVRALDRSRLDICILLFSDGPLAKELRATGATVDVLPLSETIVNTSRHHAVGRLMSIRAIVAILSYILQLARMMRAREIDLVHTNTLKSALIGAVAAILARKPLIWHIHDRVAKDYMPGSVARVFSFLARVWPEHLIANSQSTLDTLLPYPRDKCHVIFPGVDLADIPMRSLSRASPDPLEGVVVGIVGRISPTKGQDIFVQAAALVLKRYPKTRFQIIGGALFNDSAYETEIRALVASHFLEDMVEFTGFVNDVTVRMGALDILVHASTTPEPFGQVVVEGMAAGVPVIAIDTGGIPEIVENRESGLLIRSGDPCDMANAICQMLEMPLESQRMTLRARKRVEALFTIQRTARMVESVYEMILGVGADGQRAMTRLEATCASDVGAADWD